MASQLAGDKIIVFESPRSDGALKPLIWWHSHGMYDSQPMWTWFCPWTPLLHLLLFLPFLSVFWSFYRKDGHKAKSPKYLGMWKVQGGIMTECSRCIEIRRTILHCSKRALTGCTDHIQGIQILATREILRWGPCQVPSESFFRSLGTRSTSVEIRLLTTLVLLTDTVIYCPPIFLVVIQFANLCHTANCLQITMCIFSPAGTLPAKASRLVEESVEFKGCDNLCSFTIFRPLASQTWPSGNTT